MDKTLTFNDLMDSGYLSVACGGDENATLVLTWLVRSLWGMLSGNMADASDHPLRDTPEFKVAHNKLLALGLVKPNPAAGPRDYMLDMQKLAADFSAWHKSQNRAV